MQAKCRQEEAKKIESEIGDQLLSRDQLLSIFKQLLELEKSINDEFAKEKSIDRKDYSQDEQYELQYKQAVSEAQFFDQLYKERKIEERAYFYSLRKIDV